MEKETEGEGENKTGEKDERERKGGQHDGRTEMRGGEEKGKRER